MTTISMDYKGKTEKSDRNNIDKSYPQKDFLPERLIIISQFLPALGSANILIMVMAYFLLKNSVPPYYLYTVILLNITVTLGVLAHDHLVRSVTIKNGRALHDNDHIIRCHIQYIIALGVIGAIWGSSAILFIDSIHGDFFNLTTQANPTALYICAMVGSSGLAIALGAVPSVFFSLTFCMMVPYTGVLLLHPATNYNWMGYGSVICLMTIIFLGWRIYQNSIRTLTLQHENTTLMGDLKAESLALAKANKDKSRFLAAASHDLRQPLHTSSLLLGILQEELTTKNQKDRLKNLKQAVEAQTELLNALLNVSQLDAGIVKANPAHIQLNNALTELENEFKPEAAEQDRELAVEKTDLIALTDKVLLQRILRNLLTNAFRHTKACPINLGVQRTEKHINIYIKDSGPGISEQETDNIYSEFYQLNNPERDRNKGLGLGLSIVKRLCDLLDHPISMESTLNVGTCFTITVPHGQSEKVKHKQTNSTFDLNLPIAGHHIMVVDDEKGVIDAMRVAVEQWSCQFSFAYSVEDALTLIKAGETPDMLISDYRLPNEQTGLNCIKSIRAALNEDIPALLISGDTDPEILTLISDSQLNCLHKPVKFAQLRIAVTRLLKPQHG